MSWLRTSSFILAITAVGGIGSLLSASLCGCGASDSGAEFGTPTGDDSGDAGSTGEVIVPPTNDGSDGAPLDNGTTDVKCVASSSDLGTVCIHVARKLFGPAITDQSKAMGIDGSGALVVMLMPDPWVKTATPVVVKMYPSPSSGKDSFDVSADLPKTTDLDVKPGKYIPFAVFYDQPGFGSRPIDAGDYVPKMKTEWDVLPVDVAAGSATDVFIDLYPVRAMDISVGLSTTVHPLGSGSGPLAAGLVAPDGTIAGIATVSCADVQTGKAAAHLLTTAAPSGTDPSAPTAGYGVRVGLYDFAAGPDDPSVDPSLPPPPGTIVNFDSTRAPMLKLGDGWLTSGLETTLDRVVPFVDVAPADPTPSCTAYGAAPK